MGRCNPGLGFGDDSKSAMQYTAVPSLDIESTRFPLHAAALVMRERVRHSLQLQCLPE